MIQPPSKHATCPRCGNPHAVLVLTESNLPQLDAFGSPRYSCPVCHTSFSSADADTTPLNRPKQMQQTREDEVQ